VASPGAYDFTEGITAFGALTRAGGPSKFGKLNKTRVIRMEEGKSKNFRLKLSEVAEKGKLEHDLALKPGDTIIVSGGFF